MKKYIISVNAEDVEYVESVRVYNVNIKDFIDKIDLLIADEIMICHQENTPTSRLTSLWMKIVKLFK